MSSVFLKVLNMSIAASWLIAVVLLLRLVLRKAPRWINCVLWALVALRLVIPFTFESALSVVPSSETISIGNSGDDSTVIHTGIPVLDQTAGKVFSIDEAGEGAVPVSESGMQKPMSLGDFLRRFSLIGSIVWAAGVTAMLLWGLLSFIRIRKTTITAVPLRDNIMASDEVASPFILGVLRPRVYVPSGLDGQELDYALAHEEAHLKRHDHWWKPLGFLILSVYWFNPLCWAAYVLLCRDIEYACDEKVLREMGGHHLKEYASSLLELSLQRRRITACPLAFGEMSVKQRVRKVLTYKKPAFWVIIVSMIICVIVAGCFLTDPKEEAQSSSENNETVAIETDATKEPSELPSESKEPETTVTPSSAETPETTEQTPSEQERGVPVEGALYGVLSPEDEEAALEVAVKHVRGLIEGMKYQSSTLAKLITFTEEDISAVLSAPWHWGEMGPDGFAWMYKMEINGVQGYPDRIAFVDIVADHDENHVMSGYVVELIKTLDTDTWIVVDYGY